MSFEFYAEESPDALQPGAQVLQPDDYETPYWKGLGRELAAAPQRAVYGTGAALGLAAGALNGPIDALLGTHLQDDAFATVSRLRAARERLTLRPDEVGLASRALGGLLEFGTQLATTGAAGAIGTIELNTAADLAAEGVDPQTAVQAGVVDAAATALAFRVPVLGRSLGSRLALGAGANVATGAGQRALTGAVLSSQGFEQQAQRFNPWDAEALVVDALTGALFGGWEQYARRSPRAQPRAAGEAVAPESPPVEVLDGAAALSDHTHRVAGTAPGEPTTAGSLDAHVRALDEALDAVLNDRPVEASVAAELFAPDPRRAAVRAEIEAAAADLLPIAPDLDVAPAVSPAAKALADIEALVARHADEARAHRGDVDRQRARITDRYFDELPPDTQDFLINRPAFDAETGETHRIGFPSEIGGGGDMNIHGTHMWNLAEEVRQAELEREQAPRGVAPPPAPGMVRYYHGGAPSIDHDGPLWFTADLNDARGWADRSSDMRVWYVDVPEGHPARGEGDLAAGIPFRSRVELPADLAMQRQPFDGQSAPPAKAETASERMRRLSRVDPAADDLLAAVAKEGGISRAAAEAAGIDPAEFTRRGWRIKPIFTKGGISLEAMAERLIQRGYPVGDADGYGENPMLATLDRALRGESIRTAEGMERAARGEAVQRMQDERQRLADAMTIAREAGVPAEDVTAAAELVRAGEYSVDDVERILADEVAALDRRMTPPKVDDAPQAIVARQVLDTWETEGRAPEIELEDDTTVDARAAMELADAELRASADLESGAMALVACALSHMRA